MATKVVLVINGRNALSGSFPAAGYVPQAHAFGATESFYVSLGIGTPLTNLLKNNIGPKRAAILATGTEITAARLYQDGGGRGVVVPLGLPGSGGGSINQANDALLLSTTDPSANPQRKFWLHFIPDGQVFNGEFQPTGFWATKLLEWMGQMEDKGQWRSIVRGNLTNIVSVSASGLVTFSVNNPFAVGNQIEIRRVLLSNGNRFGGRFAIASVGPLATQVTISGWPNFSGVGGTAFLKSSTLLSMGTGQGLIVERAGTRRVGRPTDLYRGRKSRRRAAV
jgi:hypothetical protein